MEAVQKLCASFTTGSWNTSYPAARRQIAVAYRVHRVIVARWLSACRQTMLAQVSATLGDKLRLDQSELSTLFRAVSFAKILSQRLDDGPAACEPGSAMSLVSLCWARCVRRSEPALTSLSRTWRCGNERLEKHAKRRPERHTSGHRAKEPPQWPTASFEWKELSHESERQRDDTARSQAGEKSPENQLRRRLCGSRDRGQHNKRHQRSEHDPTPPDAIRKEAVDERRYAVGDEVRRDCQPHHLGRGIERHGEARNERRDRVSLEKNEERSRREDPQQVLAGLNLVSPCAAEIMVDSFSERSQRSSTTSPTRRYPLPQQHGRTLPSNQLHE